ncbi:ADQ_G0006510.mRNA.1.CDS.1 [Saccharomyces cerevisiae]|nr:ADQ_G0006510.mRNA.1.CDS.1 [Saccharomyces cerevisiae]CAI6526028.1 ADQ_G0006510.mRNA.1.CDS.1 [Saccharomyces cerevisiae]
MATCEARVAGANTLSAHHSCPAWDDDVNDDILKKYNTKYLSGIAKRLKQGKQGGYSDICNIFTKDELVRFSYSQDLETYYQTGPGYDVVRSVGANLFNASVKLLKESEVQDQKVWLSFTHDTDILNYLTTIGIIDDKNNLTAEYCSIHGQHFPQILVRSSRCSCLHRKFQCSNDTYVRYVINDAVVPIGKPVLTGPGFSCEINDFYDYAERE